MKTKILKLFGLIAIVTSIMVSISVPLASTDLSESEFTDKYLGNNVERVELAKKVAERIYDYYGIKNRWKDTYPSFYGGMYISDDATSLIIQIVKENIPDEYSREYSIYKEIINMDESIKIEYVKNSFNEINNANNHVSDYFESYNAKSTKISSSYIDVLQNAVVIEMVNNSKEQQEDFKKNFFDLKDYKKDINSNLIIFNQSVELKVHADLKPGGWIAVDPLNPNVGCSMGYRTKWNGKAGYVTAGHCFYGTGYTINTGKVMVQQLINNQNYDYAFVETNSSWTPTNNLMHTKTNYTKLAVDQYAFVVTNSAIAKSGNTTKYTEGKVTGFNATVYYSNLNVTIKGLVKTNIKSDLGDSGAPVFVPQTDANGGSIAIGILSGGGPVFLGISNVMYFTEMYDLPSPLQIRY